MTTTTTAARRDYRRARNDRLRASYLPIWHWLDSLHRSTATFHYSQLIGMWEPFLEEGAGPIARTTEEAVEALHLYEMTLKEAGWHLTWTEPGDLVTVWDESTRNEPPTDAYDIDQAMAELQPLVMAELPGLVRWKWSGASNEAYRDAIGYALRDLRRNWLRNDENMALRKSDAARWKGGALHHARGRAVQWLSRQKAPERPVDWNTGDLGELFDHKRRFFIEAGPDLFPVETAVVGIEDGPDAEAFRRAVRRLSKEKEGNRRAFLLGFYEQLPWHQVGERTGVEPATAKQRAQRTRERLRKAPEMQAYRKRREPRKGVADTSTEEFSEKCPWSDSSCVSTS